MKKYELKEFKNLFLAGERCDINTIEWARDALKKNVLDHYWQTESVL
jgi:propionyl-CoA synthetase